MHVKESRTEIGHTIQGMTLRSVCSKLGVKLPASLEKDADELLTGISSSSMTAKPGNLFVVRGSSDKLRSDARRAWAEKGVIAFLTPRPITDSKGKELPSIICKRPTAAILALAEDIRKRVNAKILVLTGSIGKTSTKEMVRLVAQQGFSVKWSSGNSNGFSQVLATLQRIEKETEFVVQEAGMGKPGSVERATKMLRPDYFIITNIGLNHIEYYDGKQENILAEKLNVDKQAAPGAVGFVNWDDPLLREAEYSHRVVSFGAENSVADISAENVVEENGKVLFDVVERAGGVRTPVALNIVGKHNVYNALAAFAVGVELGIDRDKIVVALARFRATGVRQNLTWLAGQHVYLDCYNASEGAIESCAATMETVDVPEGAKRILVVGDIDDKLGAVTEEVHRRVGRTLAGHSGIGLFIFFGEHMRWAAEEAAASGAKMLATCDRNELHRIIEENVCEGDFIGFKGGQQMQLPLTLDALYGTDFFLLDGDMTAKVAKPAIEIDGIRYRVLEGYGAELIRFRGLRFTKAGKGLLGRALRSKTGFALAPQAQIDGMPVCCIDGGAFRGSKLAGIKLPENVRAVGVQAFADCEKLVDVSLPSTLRYIAPRAFQGCTSLKRIVIPEGVTTIAQGAFEGCTSLEEVLLPASLGTLDDQAFAGCENVRLVHAATS